MKGSRVMALAGLGLLAAAIWLRLPLGAAWVDLLPALAAFPLYGWLSQPWIWRTPRGELRWGALAAAGAVLVIGAAVDSTLVLAVGWVLLWRAWLGVQLVPGAMAVQPRALVLLVCAFPWLGPEGQAVGWWFRYSGAWGAAGLFGAAGFEVARDGTFLTVQGLPLAVDEACSGLHALQAMLVAGTVLAWVMLAGWRFWVGVALLPLLAWAANLSRIVTLGVTGLSFGPEAALGWFHSWGGWAVLMAMFGLCVGVFRVLAGIGRPERRTA